MFEKIAICSTVCPIGTSNIAFHFSSARRIVKVFFLTAPFVRGVDKRKIQCDVFCK